MSRRSGWIRSSLVMIVVVMIAGCVPDAPTTTTTTTLPPASGTVTVLPNGAATLLGTDQLAGVSLTIPSGAFPTGAIVSLIPVDSPSTSIPSDSQGQAFEIRSTAEPRSAVTLRTPASMVAAAAGDDLALSWWSVDLGRWQTVPTSFDVATDEVIAEIWHFSTWNSVLKTVAGQSFEIPSCSSPPPWAVVSNTAKGEFGIAGSCAGTDSASGGLEVRVISNHAGFSYALFDHRPDRVALEGGMATIGFETGHGYYVLIPPDTTVEAVYSQPPPPGRSINPKVGRDGYTYLADLALTALNFLPGKWEPVVVTALNMSRSCYDTYTAGLGAGELGLMAAVECAIETAATAAAVAGARGTLKQILEAATVLPNIYAAARDFTGFLVAGFSQLDLVAASLYGNLPDAAMGEPYLNQLTTPVGATEPLTWRVTSGSLPPGLSLDESTGVISGTPTALGFRRFSLRMDDANGFQAFPRVSITVRTPWTTSGTVNVTFDKVWVQTGASWTSTATYRYTEEITVKKASTTVNSALGATAYSMATTADTAWIDYDYAVHQVTEGDGACESSVTAKGSDLIHAPNVTAYWSQTGGWVDQGNPGFWAATSSTCDGGGTGRLAQNLGPGRCTIDPATYGTRLVGQCTFSPATGQGLSGSQTISWDLTVSRTQHP